MADDGSARLSVTHDSSSRDVTARPASREASASWLSQATFTWLQPLIRLGRERPLADADVEELREKDRVDVLLALYQRERAARSDRRSFADGEGDGADGGDPSVVRPLLGVVWRPMALAGVCKFFGDALGYVGPIVLGMLVDWVDEEDDAPFGGAAFGYYAALALFVAAVVQSVLLHQHHHLVIREGFHVKSIVIAAVHARSLLLPVHGSSSRGEITNLVAADSQRLMDTAYFGHYLWAAPLQLLVTFLLLVNALGWLPAAAGFGVMALFVPVQTWLARVLGRLSSAIVSTSDERIQIMSEVFSSIRTVKYQAWERVFRARGDEVREREVRVIFTSAVVRAANFVTLQSIPLLVAVVSFAVFSAESGEPLTANKAFTSLALFNIMRLPLFILPRLVSILVDSRVSAARLAAFFRQRTVQARDADPAQEPRSVRLRAGDTYRWQPPGAPGGSDRSAVVLDRDVAVRAGGIMAVVGAVGAGKSSLLAAVVGELWAGAPAGGPTPPRAAAGTVAYAAQSPWLRSDTLRGNITFGHALDAKVYARVVRACGLEQDLDALPAGDMTEIGEKGVTVSGGQKARISLARAAYAHAVGAADVVVMDDPLSALDGETAEMVWRECVCGVLATATRVLATHRLDLAARCDAVAVMEWCGDDPAETAVVRVRAFGAPGREVRLDSSDLVAAANSTGDAGDDVPRTSDAERDRGAIGGLRRQTSESESRAASASAAARGKESSAAKKKGTGKLVEEEHREEGAVSWSTVSAYLRSCGVWACAVTLVLMVLSELGNVATSLWLARWGNEADEPDARSQGYYLGIYAAISGVTLLLILAFNMTGSLAGVRGSRRVYSRLISGLVSAPPSFFDTTPLGRITNRLSRDTTVVDTLLNQTVMQLATRFASMFAVLAVIAAVTRGVFAAALLVLAYAFVRVQQFYRPASRELNRLVNVARSPVFSGLAETVDGVSTVRAYGATGRFAAEMHERCRHHDRPFWMSNLINRWLGVRLDSLGAAVVFVTAALVAVFRDELSPGLAGLVIGNALALTGGLNWIVRLTIDSEVQMNAIERTTEYAALEPEGSGRERDDAAGPEWPARGAVTLDDLSLRYRPGLPLVLRGVTADVRAGMRVGVVGRTGSGKSTLIAALFRMVEPAGGRCLIDGVDTSTVPLPRLRSALCIVPQNPTLFSGSVRFNLDPTRRVPDDDAWRALGAVRLDRLVRSLDGGLDAEVGEGGGALSVGERQLVCLARAVLQKSAVLILDEATASTDAETDAQIQEMLRTTFRGRTTITIAHRVETLADYDRVLVLDAGRVKQFGTFEEVFRDGRAVVAGDDEGGELIEV